MRALIVAVILLFPIRPAEAAKAVPQSVVDRLRILIRSELDTQMKAASGAQCSEDEAMDTAERNLQALERAMDAIELNKTDKYTNLIAFFKDKMVRKCCELAGKAPKAGGRGLGLGIGGGGGGGGRGRGRQGQ